MNLIKYTILLHIYVVSAVIHNNYDECGKSSASTGLVYGGNNTKPGQWPWTARLAHKTNKKYLCGATVISKKHVLSAAHCILNIGSTVPHPANSIRILLGGYDISNTNEWTIRDVAEITLHPDWKKKQNKFDADLSVLEMDQPVTFSDRIRRICLPPPGDQEFTKIGSVVGYGITENGTFSQFPQLIEIPTINTVLCLTTYPDFAKFVSPRMYCAGTEGNIPCVGDSGNGFHEKDSKESWTIYGIASSTIYVRQNFCNASVPTAFTSVPRFSKWIKDTISAQSRCAQPLNLGICDEDEEKFYFDSKLQKCRRFYYSGCDGNENRFDSMTECENTCKPKLDAPAQDQKLSAKEDASVTLKCPVSGGPTPTITWTHNGAIVEPETERYLLPSSGDLQILFLNMANAGKYVCAASNGVGGKAIHTFDLAVHQVVKGGKKTEDLYHMRDEKRKLYVFVPFTSTIIDTKTHEFASDRDVKVQAFVAWNIRTISYLPIKIDETFPNLISYNLGKCSVKEISKENFRNLRRIERLTLTDNKISSIDKDVFDDLVALRNLGLNGNQLTSLHEDTFINNQALEELYLNQNQLESLPMKLLQNLRKLKIVFLPENKLKAIDENFFATNSKLEKIWLENNQIEYLHADTFQGLAHLKNVDLRWNKCINNHFGELNGTTFEDLSKLNSDVKRFCSKKTKLVK